MRWLALVLILAGCAPPPPSDLERVLTSNDLLVRVSGREGDPATFQLFQNGRGSAEFEQARGFPVAFRWTLHGARFCVTGGADSTLGDYCATVRIDGDRVTFADIQTGQVTTARLIAR